jgi:hypothetical protein
MTADDQANLLDLIHSVSLCGAGACGYLAGTVVAADGSTHLCLVQEAALGDETVLYDRNCADVGHEQVGPLPVAMRDRIRRQSL